MEYCPTDDMIGDYMSKPLQGYKFRKFRSQIMGEDVKWIIVSSYDLHIVDDRSVLEEIDYSRAT